MGKLEQGDKNAAAKSDANVGFTLADAKPGDLPPKTAKPGPTDLVITGTDDDKVPATRQERLQEFVDGFGKLGKLYHDNTQNVDRLGRFQDRMMGVYGYDHSTFKELARLGEAMTGPNPPSPEAIGKGLAQVFKNTLDRALQTGNVDLQSPDMLNVEGSLSGMMLAAQSTFHPPKDAEQTKKMVDALDAEFLRQKVPHMRGIIFGDTKEPGVAAVPDGATIDRHNYIPKE